MRFRFVDDLRGVAATGVALSHLVWLLPSWLHVFELGRLGVEVFFVISGFVMAYSLRDADISGSFIGRFALRRSIRLDPPYWAVIVLELVVLMLWIEPLPPLRDILLNAVYLHEITSSYPIVIVAWTLCLELQFYLVLVLLLGLRQALRRRLGVDRVATDLLAFGPLAVASLLVGLSPLFEVYVDVTIGPPWALFLPYWYLFFSGVLLAWVLIDGRPTWWVLGYQGIVVAAMVSYPERGLLPEEDLSALAGVVVVTLFLAVGRTEVLQRGFGVPLISYLGRISYSLYLVHFVIGVNLILVVERRYGSGALPMFVAFGLALGASLVAAHLLHRFVEAPSVELARRVGLGDDRIRPARPTRPVPGISTSSRQTGGAGRRSGHGDDAARPGWRR